MQAQPWPFEPFVRSLVAHLVRGEYGRLEELSGGIRLSAAELARAVRAYPARLTLPPPGQDPPLGVVQVAGALPRAWAVDVPLWSAGEGRSDLTLQLSVREDGAGGYRVEIDDLHVL